MLEYIYIFLSIGNHDRIAELVSQILLYQFVHCLSMGHLVTGCSESVKAHLYLHDSRDTESHHHQEKNDNDMPFPKHYISPLRESQIHTGCPFLILRIGNCIFSKREEDRNKHRDIEIY